MEYRLSVLTSRLLVDNRQLALQARALELAIALATHGRRLGSLTLAEMLYPEMEERSALDRLRVTAFRLRAQAPGLIQRSRTGGYSLSDVESDFDELFGGESAEGSRYDQATFDRLILIADQNRRSITGRWLWFAPIEGRLQTYRVDLCARLSQRIQPGDDAAGALGVARRLLAIDECDEAAFELAMRCLHLLERPIEAIKLYREFSRAVEKEYGAEPSPELRALAGIA